MDKNKVIEIAKEYLDQEVANIDTHSILDKSPVEFEAYWCFNAYYEDLDPRRGDGIKTSKMYPFILVSKKKGEITLGDWDTYAAIKKI